MARSLYQKLLQDLYFKDGELSKGVKEDVVALILDIMTKNEGCYQRLTINDLPDATERAYILFLIGWKNMVRESDNMWDFRRKMTTLCLNACQIERRRTRAITDAPMGVRMGDDFPCTWEI